MLRLRVQGPVRSRYGRRSSGSQTFVLCGTPKSGMLLLKAFWPVSHHAFVQKLFQFTPWPSEGSFLDALEVYHVQSASAKPAMAATAAWRALGGKGRRDLFSGRWDEQKVVWIARLLAEMPDDRSIAGFVRRVITPLLFGVVAVGIVITVKLPPQLVAAGVVLGAVSLFISARIVWTKAAAIWRYRRGRRASQADLYTKPIRYREVDASGDTTPTFIQASAELEALGAKHICDFDAEIGDVVAQQGSRVYALGDARVMVGLVRQTPNSLIFFPAKPIFILSTRFTDGRQHSTTDAELYERARLAHITTRRLPEDGNLIDLVELHRRHVARLLAQGAVPVPPPATSAQVFNEMDLEQQEERRAWQQSLCSWSDAIHFVFKICPREYRSE